MRIDSMVFQPVLAFVSYSGTQFAHDQDHMGKAQLSRGRQVRP